MSNSVKDIAAGMKMRCKYRTLPNAEFVVPAVQEPDVTTASISSNEKFCVIVIFDARASEIRMIPAAVPEETLMLFPPVIVIGPELKEPAAPMLFTRFVGALIPMMLAPLLEIVIFGPADKVIVPVLEPPGAEMAFKPLIEIVIELAAVAVCKLIFAPAAKAKDSAVPAMLVPLALMVFVPIGCTVWEFALS